MFTLLHTLLHTKKTILLSSLLLCFQLYPMKNEVEKTTPHTTRVIIPSKIYKSTPRHISNALYKIIATHAASQCPWDDFDRLLELRTVSKRWNKIIGDKQKIAKILNIPPMHCAAMTGDIQEIFELKDKGFSISEPDKRRLTPLDYALACNQENSIKLLTLGSHDKKPSPTYILEDLKNAITNNQYDDAITILLCRGDLAVKWLSDRKTKEARNTSKSTNLLDNLIKYCTETYIENYLFTHINGIEEKFCHDMYFELMEKKYANPNTCDKRGNYFLHYLCLLKKKDLYPLLIKFLQLKKINVNAKAPFKVTPLHLAANDGYFDALVALLKTDQCYVSPLNDEGYPPIYYSVQNGHLECVKALIEYGVKPAIPLPNNENLLHVAAMNGHTQILEYLIPLLQKQINHQDIFGQTPLMWCVIENPENAGDCIQLLLDNGADVNIKTNDRYTPLRLAKERGYWEIVEQLLDYGISKQ
jgi:ankyrin repeat protein